MTANEMAILIGEYLYVDINEVNDVKYIKSDKDETCLRVILINGKKISIEVKAVKN